MKKYVFFGASCALFSCFLLPVYAASSVRVVGGNTNSNTSNISSSSVRASSLPVAKKTVVKSGVVNTNVSGTQNVSSEAQRMPFGSHISSISVPASSYVPVYTEFSGKDAAEVMQLVGELEEKTKGLEKDIADVNISISDQSEQVEAILDAIDEIDERFDIYATKEDLEDIQINNVPQATEKGMVLKSGDNKEPVWVIDAEKKLVIKQNGAEVGTFSTKSPEDKVVIEIADTDTQYGAGGGIDIIDGKKISIDVGTNNEGKVLKVNSEGTNVEWADVPVYVPCDGDLCFVTKDGGTFPVEIWEEWLIATEITSE